VVVSAPKMIPSGRGGEHDRTAVFTGLAMRRAMADAQSIRGRSGAT
jgi:hypothetical protein